MFILIKTDTGARKVINTEDISFVDAPSSTISVIYTKTNPDFPIRVEMNIKDFVRVISGEVEFDALDKTAGKYTEFQDESKIELVGPVKPSSPEEIDEVKKEISEGLVGAPGKSVSIKPEPTMVEVAAKIPTFSKKVKKDKAVW
jgi:hypothetical protein